MPADKIISINLDSTNPRQANVNAMPAFTFGNTDRVRIELYSGGELAAFDTTKDYIFALGINGRASAGGYVLTYGGDSTQELTATAAPSAVESALNALASVAALGGLKVVGSNGGPYKIVWTEPGEREAISAKNTLYPNAAVYSRIITSGDDGTAAQQALAFKLSLLSGMSNVQYLDVERTTETTEYVEVQKPVSVTTKITETDPETGKETTTETTETRTETVTEPQVNTTTEKIKGAMEFDLSLATVEAFLAIGGASNLSAMAELAEVSASGEIKTRLLCECSILNGVIPDAGTLIIASQELANMTATAKFYAIGTQENPPSIIAGTIPSESDKGSAYYYAQLAANSQAATEGAEEAAQQAEAAKETAVNAANGATEAAQAAQASQAAAAQSESNAQESATEAAGSATQAQTSATNAQAAQAAAETAAQIAQATDAGKLALDKLSAGTLYFDKGKLSGSNFAIPNFPFSICATVRIDAWSGEQNQTIMQFGNAGETPIVSLNFGGTQQSPTIAFQIISTSSVVSSLTCNLDYADFIGKTHTIIAVCRNLDSSGTLDWSLYLDGQSLSGAAAKNLKIDALSGSGEYAINTVANNDPSSAASANPMMLRNLYVFNFDISAEGSPYSIADYEAGRLIPPSLIGNQFTGMYGSGWSVSGDTATCSGTSTESYPRITGGVIPSGFNFSFTIDIELSFSGTPSFEFYTDCQKAHAEIYDYSTQLTTKKDSAPGGGFYGNASLGITASGHYKIKFNCESSLGNRGRMQMVIGALSSGTIILSDTYYSRCNLALENYTIARNATTTLVKDASGNSNDATVTGNVAGDNDQSIKVFVDEIKTQINQSNG